MNSLLSASCFVLLLSFASSQIAEFSLVVDNMSRADLNQQSLSVLGATISQNTCGNILKEYGACQMLLIPDGSLQNVTFKAIWGGLGSPFGFYATLNPQGSTVEIGLLSLPQLPLVNGSACYAFESASQNAIGYVSFCQPPNPCARNALCGRSN